MIDSVFAIRYLDPEWDFLEPGQRLYPRVVYWLGEGNSNSDDNDKDFTDSDDVEQDKIWTL